MITRRTLGAVLLSIPLAPRPGRAQAPAAPSPAAPPAGGPALPTLVPGRGDPGNVDEVLLPERAVLAWSGTSGWDDGLSNLRAAFSRLRGELARLAIVPAGRPLALFRQTTDDGFQYDALVPVAAAPDPLPALSGAEFRWSTSPSGKAFRFVHRGPYEGIDTTYETVVTYLEAKNIPSRDAFLEEFLDEIADPADPRLEVNIFVQPK